MKMGGKSCIFSAGGVAMLHEGFGHFYKSQVAVSVSSLFSAAGLFKRRVFNAMFKNPSFENKGLAKPGLYASENGQSLHEA
jgi:hypothetical protein